MALKSAYNYVRENIDSNFDKYVADNVSYGCEEDIEDIKRWISEEGEDAQVALYYAQHEGAYVFNDVDIYVEGMDISQENPQLYIRIHHTQRSFYFHPCLISYRSMGGQ